MKAYKIEGNHVYVNCANDLKDYVTEDVLTAVRGLVDELNDDYEQLKENYEKLEDDWETLEEQHTNLGADYTALEQKYAMLEAEYDELKSGLGGWWY